MSAVKYFVILILGTVIVRFFGMSGSDKVQERAQICYVTDVIDGAYVSREAYRTLVGIMPNNFLRIESATQHFLSVSSAAGSPSDEECDCSCHIRTKPSPLPIALPFPTTDANGAALQKRILERYRSSTFNTCEYQTLSVMKRLPLELHLDPPLATGSKGVFRQR